MQSLMEMDSIEVQEKASMIEALTALIGHEVEMSNKYNVFDPKGDKVFFAVEQTDCCTRQLQRCAADCAPFDLQILHLLGTETTAFKLQRPWTCTCCCFNRPVLNVTDGNNNPIGSIRDPWACCDLTFTIRDVKDEDVLQVRGGCCQPGLCCPLPCGPCSEVHFKMHDMSDNELGHVTKKVPSCLKFVFASDVDNYKVDWKGVEDANLRALMLALTIFIDFRYFNDNKNDNGEQKPLVG